MKADKRFYFILTACFSFLFAILTAIVSDHFFFWDTIVQASRSANWFYENHFSSILIPNSFDAGHPPLFGIYLAFVWSIFGKTLSVSHWAMFPFIAGIIYQTIKLIGRFTDKKNIIIILILVLADATFLSQSILVSPDIVILFTFLWALNSILEKRKFVLVIALILQSLCNTRGIILSFCLFTIDIFVIKKLFSFRRLIKRIPLYLPAAILVIAYYTYHYIEKGWIISYAGSEYEGGRKMVDLWGVMKNIFVFSWRWGDFGRVFLWIAFLILSLRYFKRKNLFEKKQFILVNSLLLFITITFFSFVFLSNSIGHRYFLPGYFLFSILLSVWIFHIAQNTIYKYVLMSVLILGCISGNFWRYPEGIAMGWDSTLGHYPYYSLRDDVLNYLDRNKISYEKVGSDFPAIDPLSMTDLNNDQRRFSAKNFRDNDYILYSNVFNDFSNTEIDTLKQYWKVEKSFKKGIIEVILYKKP
jgi:hypothetical protein